MASLRQKALRGLKAGDTLTVTRTFTRDETEAFGSLTRDENPVHHDEDFAGARGLSSTIIHGLLTGSMITEIGGQIGCLASGMDFRFVRPVYPGDTVTCTLTVDELDAQGRKMKGTAMMRNQRGELVVQVKLAGHQPVGSELDVLRRVKPPRMDTPR
jgi:3-hydroxybutyryl-CoA dehydratase